jgi:hypothetical protein
MIKVHSPVVASDGSFWITCSAFGCTWQVKLEEHGGYVRHNYIHTVFNTHLAERFGHTL